MSGENGLGGMGGLLADPTLIPSDCRTLARAFVERWPIPPERRQRILTTLQQIVESDTFEVEKTETEGGPNGEGAKTIKVGSITMPNHRNQVAAARVLLTAFKVDQDDQHHLEDLAAGIKKGVNIFTGPTIVLEGECWGKMLQRIKADDHDAPAGDPAQVPRSGGETG